jgi:hypothetical protein
MKTIKISSMETYTYDANGMTSTGWIRFKPLAGLFTGMMKTEI